MDIGNYNICGIAMMKSPNKCKKTNINPDRQVIKINMGQGMYKLWEM